MTYWRVNYAGFSLEVGGIPFSEVTADDLKAILSKLEEVPDIEDYPINDFLVKASERDAEAVIGLLLNRIRRSDNEKLGYNGTPSTRLQ